MKITLLDAGIITVLPKKSVKQNSDGSYTFYATGFYLCSFNAGFDGEVKIEGIAKITRRARIQKNKLFSYFPKK